MSEEIKATASACASSSERLADPDLGDEKAEELAREAAELGARGGVLLTRGCASSPPRRAPSPMAERAVEPAHGRRRAG